MTESKKQKEGKTSLHMTERRKYDTWSQREGREGWWCGLVLTAEGENFVPTPGDSANNFSPVACA
jgi:hypothetical protein